MTILFQCNCGGVRGQIEPRAVHVRATCYCRDCQAFAHALGREDVLDARGGTDIVAMLPSGLRFTAGTEQLACLSLSPKGLLRWHARCCGTPLANSPRDAKLAYVGVLAHCAAADALDAVIGPSRIALNVKSARGPVTATPVRTALGVLRIMRRVLLARLRGRGEHPFFIAGTHQPVAEPRVLSKAERAAATPA